MDLATRSLTSSTVRPRSAGTLRTGLIIAVVVSVGNVIPALDVGLDGTPWDVLVIFLAILCPLIAVGTIVLTVFAWSGKRRPAGAVAALQLIAIIGLLPAFPLFFIDGLPVIAPISAAITILIEVLAAWLILHGRAPR